MKLPEELFDFIKKNEEYLIYKTELSGSKKIFKVNYDLFREQFTDLMTQQGIVIENSEVVIQILNKFSSSKILRQLLIDFAFLWSSIRVLELYSKNISFFLAASHHPRLLNEIFGLNVIFQNLNKEMSTIFRNEDEYEKKKNSSIKPATKGIYYCALKGEDFLCSRVMKPTGIEAQNFSELSHFFIKFPAIRHFLDKNREVIQKLGAEYKAHGSRKNSSESEIPKLRRCNATIFSFGKKINRKREASDVVKKLNFGSSIKKPKIEPVLEGDSQLREPRVLI